MEKAGYSEKIQINTYYSELSISFNVLPSEVFHIIFPFALAYVTNAAADEGLLKCTDFVLYYFENQYAWNLFPDKSREKLKVKLTSMAARYRIKHPEKNLKVMFWPKVALSGFQGMNHYDPMFGEAFYNDSFHCGILHEDILKKITCDVIFMKAQTNIDKNGILMAALSEEDLSRVLTLIPSCKIVRYDCGHGIHVERKKEFTTYLLNL